MKVMKKFFEKEKAEIMEGHQKVNKQLQEEIKILNTHL